MTVIKYDDFLVDSIRKKDQIFLEDFSPMLALPPHNPNNPNQTYSLSQLYYAENKDIVRTGMRINTLTGDSGPNRDRYIRLVNKKNGMKIIYQNESFLLFGLRADSLFSVGNYEDIRCDDESLIIYNAPYDSLYIITVDDFDEYDLTIVKTKRVINERDPYGEEEWGDEEIYE